MRPGVQHVQFAAAHFAQRGEYQRVPHAQVLGRQHRQRDALLMGERVLQGEHLHRATAVRPGIAELVPQKKRHNGGESQ